MNIFDEHCCGFRPLRMTVLVALLAAPACAATTAAAEPPDACRPAPASATAAGWPTRQLAWRAHPRERVVPRAQLPGARRAATARGARGLDPGRTPWLLVLGRARDDAGRCWVRLRLPWRPNDAAGWLPADLLELRATRWRIEIARARRTLTLLHAGRRALRVSVVVGAPATPTPGGLFAVACAWRNPASSFSGAWIVALTAHSRVLRRFDGGQGTVGIHGRGGASLLDPLGTAASHGCVRLANDDIRRLVRAVGRDALAGVPVRIA